MNPLSNSFLFQNNNDNLVNRGGNDNKQFCGNINSIFNNIKSNSFLNNERNSLSTLSTNSNSSFGLYNFNNNFKNTIFENENNIKEKEEIGTKQIENSLSSMSLEESRLKDNKYNNFDYLSNNVNPFFNINSINNNIFKEINNMQSYPEKPFYKKANHLLNDRSSLSNNSTFSMFNNINNNKLDINKIGSLFGNNNESTEQMKCINDNINIYNDKIKNPFLYLSDNPFSQISNSFLRNNNEIINPFSTKLSSPPKDTLFGKASNENKNIVPLFENNNSNTISLLSKLNNINNNSVNIFNNNDYSKNIFPNSTNNLNSIFQNNKIENRISPLNPFANINNQNNIFQNFNTKNEQNNPIFSITNKLDSKKDNNIFLNRNDNTSSQFLNKIYFPRNSLFNSNQENGIVSNKNNLQISFSSKNSFDISPLYKNNLIYIKEYSNNANNEQNKIKIFKIESNSSNISNDLERAIISHLEKNFDKKEEKCFQNKDKIDINCQIIEPVKVCFTIEIGKKDDISVLKEKICEQLKKENNAYSSLEEDSFCLMKNYSFIMECNKECGELFSDCDNIFIILKESIKKLLNMD